MQHIEQKNQCPRGYPGFWKVFQFLKQGNPPLGIGGKVSQYMILGFLLFKIFSSMTWLEQINARLTHLEAKEMEETDELNEATKQLNDLVSEMEDCDSIVDWSGVGVWVRKIEAVKR